MTKLLIYGGRDWRKRKLSYTFLDKYREQHEIELVISGMARGADRIGWRWACDRKIPVKKFYAEWDNLDAVPCKIKVNHYGEYYNCLAGFNRNAKMAKLATAAIEFPGDRGTADMRQRLIGRGIQPLVYADE